LTALCDKNARRKPAGATSSNHVINMRIGDEKVLSATRAFARREQQARRSIGDNVEGPCLFLR